MATVTNNSSTSLWNSKIERLSEGNLKDMQLFRLKELVERLQNKSLFYKQRMKDASITSNDIHSLADLESLPFTYKNDLQARYPFGLFIKPLTEVSRLHNSSGSKGKPTIVGYTKEDLAIWAEVCARSLACAGVKETTLSRIVMVMDYLQADSVSIMALKCLELQLFRLQAV